MLGDYLHVRDDAICLSYPHIHLYAESPFDSPTCPHFLLSNNAGVWMIWRGQWHKKKQQIIAILTNQKSQFKQTNTRKTQVTAPPFQGLHFSPIKKQVQNSKPVFLLIPRLSCEDYNNILEMSSEYTQSLIEFDSQRMDLELQYECLFLTPLMSAKSLPPIGEYVFQKNPQVEDQLMESDEESVGTNNTQEETCRESSDTSSHKNGSLRKTKKISKKYSLPDTEDSTSQTHTKKKKGGKGKATKNPQYPTKNFLPNFKTPHLDFLQAFLKVDIRQYDFIRYLDEKDGISLKDYEHLYNMPEFTQAFKAMFKCRYLYRELMLSRSGLKAKRVHQRKLYVFEDAFENKIFPRINY